MPTIQKPFRTTIVVKVDTDFILNQVQDDIKWGAAEDIKDKYFTLESLKEFIKSYSVNEETCISMSDLDNSAQTAFAQFILDDCNKILNDYYKEN